VSSMTISNNVPLGQVANVSCAATLSTALTKNTSYGILNVSAIPAAVASTDRIVVGTGSTTQTFVPTTTIVGSTTITVAAQLANAAYPIGTQVVDSNWANSNCGASTAWISTSGVTGVTFAVTEPVTAKGSDPYAYTLTALPRASGPPNPATSVASPTATKCNFADTGSGTYASSLCFVDFTPYAAPTSGCQGMSATIPGTSYTMTFCLSVSGGPVHSAVFPTYAQAFLGNNGFYTGVGGGPALYQSNSGTTTTVTINSIQLANANGTPATGWELVTGDAETTDANESITWTSNQNLSLLPNTPTSPVGDACSYPTSPLGLSGTGTQTVVCASSTSDTTSARTGTVMLVAPAPTTLTVTLVGTGLEAMFLGILLPS
jgi:hypothetical protein